MKVTIEGDAKEIAALVLAVQERQSEDYVMVREPYQQNYSLVKVGTGREGSFEAK